MSIGSHLVKTLVEAANLAPSGDNCQPLRYVWDSPILEIHDCPERGRGFINAGNYGTWTALGAALKNMEIAGAAHGIAIETTLGAGDTLMAEVRFTSQKVIPSPLVNAIPLRAVNRKPYQTAHLSPEAKQDLQACISGAVRMEYAEQGPAFDAIAEALAFGDSFSMFDRRVHDYLFRWLRWSEEEAREKRDGMPVSTMELSRFDHVSVRMMKSWAGVRLSALFGGRGIFISKRRTLYRQSGAFGILTVKKWTPAAMLDSGGALQCLWLKATNMKLAFHGMMGFPMMEQIDKANPAAFPAQRSAELRKMSAHVREFIPSLREREMACVFRIGLAAAPSGRAPRRPVDAVLEIKK